jgi:hypothetical protein
MLHLDNLCHFCGSTNLSAPMPCQTTGCRDGSTTLRRCDDCTLHMHYHVEPTTAPRSIFAAREQRP